MYVAVHSWSFRDRFKDKSFDIFQAMDIAAEMGFKGMEIQTGKANMPPLDIGTDTVPGIKKVLRYAEKKGLRIHSFATYNDFAYVKDEAWRLANIEYIKKWLRLTGEVGVPNIRMLTGYNVEGEDRAAAGEAHARRASPSASPSPRRPASTWPSRTTTPCSSRARRSSA